MHSASEDADIVCLHNGQQTLCEDMLGGRRGGGEGKAGLVGGVLGFHSKIKSSATLGPLMPPTIFINQFTSWPFSVVFSSVAVHTR